CFVVAEDAESHDCYVNVAVFKGCVDGCRVGFGVERIEINNSNGSSASCFDLCDCCVHAWGIFTRCQGHMGWTLLEEAGDNGNTDLRGSTKKENVLGFAHCVKHCLVQALS